MLYMAWHVRRHLTCSAFAFGLRSPHSQSVNVNVYLAFALLSMGREMNHKKQEKSKKKLPNELKQHQRKRRRLHLDSWSSSSSQEEDTDSETEAHSRKLKRHHELKESKLGHSCQHGHHKRHKTDRAGVREVRHSRPANRRRSGHCRCCRCTHSESPSPVASSSRVSLVPHQTVVKTEPRWEGFETQSIEFEDVCSVNSDDSVEALYSVSTSSAPKPKEKPVQGPKRREPASAYDYKGPLKFLCKEDLGREPRKDFCLFCEELTSTMREHMLEKHLMESDVQRAYQMEISGFRHKAWSFTGFIIPAQITAARRQLHQMKKCDFCDAWLCSNLSIHAKACAGRAWDSFNAKAGAAP
ncbi:Hypothetical predicted protein [Cloeon dipterum]|uniref:Uncharacterized protein n=1 Tax=Cloeon dipterum TaxID=197152 RepID=A0A8S1EE34_9INSE|nr:Hypothetical predicted protein [Cloeon dipterum]